VLGERLWMNAARELPQLEASRLEVAPDVVKGVGVGEQVRNMSKPPLRALAQLALEPAALGIGGVDDPPPRLVHLRDPSAHLGLEPCVGDREPRRRGDRRDDTGTVENGRVVNEGRNLRGVLFDRRDGSIGSWGRELYRPSRFVDVAAFLG